MKRLRILVMLALSVVMLTQCKEENLEEPAGGGLGNDQIGGEYNGHGYIDLGLPSGLKWATCNVGAATPEAYGTYFAWGETEPAPGNNYILDYCPAYGMSEEQLRSAGIIDESGNLTSAHDAARANWGGTWRLPKKSEMRELVDECTWQWTTQSGVNGYRVTGPNGKTIFLPAAGFRRGASLLNAGDIGYYWSSSPYEYLDIGAYGLYFSGEGHDVGIYDRCYGHSVRPVSE